MGSLTTTVAKSEFAIMKAQLRAAELEHAVSRPVAEGTRYDLIVDDGKLSRVQVKYADAKSSHSSGCVFLHLSSISRSQKKPRRAYSSSEIDALLVYIPRIDKLCWLPVAVWENKQTLVLRYESTKNGQVKGCLLAQDYIW